MERNYAIAAGILVLLLLLFFVTSGSSSKDDPVNLGGCLTQPRPKCLNYDPLHPGTYVDAMPKCSNTTNDPERGEWICDFYLMEAGVAGAPYPPGGSGGYVNTTRDDSLKFCAQQTASGLGKHNDTSHCAMIYMDPRLSDTRIYDDGYGDTSAGITTGYKVQPVEGDASNAFKRMYNTDGSGAFSYGGVASKSTETDIDACEAQVLAKKGYAYTFNTSGESDNCTTYIGTAVPTSAKFQMMLRDPAYNYIA